jgi:2-methylcitrate dehydratase PrpD
VAQVLGPFTDPEIRAMFERVDVDVDPTLTAQFPQRRLTAVEIEFTSGQRLAAGPLEAPGEPDDPALAEVVEAKVRELIGSADAAPSAAPEGLAALGPEQLLAMLRDAPTGPADG